MWVYLGLPINFIVNTWLALQYIFNENKYTNIKIISR